MNSRLRRREPIHLNWQALRAVFTARRVLIALLILALLYLAVPFLLMIAVGRLG